jgi:hypothetical protein
MDNKKQGVKGCALAGSIAARRRAMQHVKAQRCQGKHKLDRIKFLSYLITSKSEEHLQKADTVQHKVRRPFQAAPPWSSHTFLTLLHAN